MYAPLFHRGFLSIFLIIPLVLITLAASGAFILTKSQFGPIKPKDIPGPLKKIVDDYIINEVGQEEFERNYRFLREDKQGCESDSSSDCSMTYVFLPGEPYGKSELYFTVRKDKTVHLYTGILPNCQKDLNKCEFKLTREDLISIAKRENLSSENFDLTNWGDRLLFRIAYCDLHSLENRREIFVDTQTGEIIQSGSNSRCSGII